MRDKTPTSQKKGFDARLREALARRSARNASVDQTQGAGLSFAVRIGVELVAALIVGVGIGLLLDRWLGTGPWLFLLFFVLGAAAGFLNVYRVMSGYGYSAGYRQPKEGEPDEGDTRHGHEGQ